MRKIKWRHIEKEQDSFDGYEYREIDCNKESILLLAKEIYLEEYRYFTIQSGGHFLAKSESDSFNLNLFRLQNSVMRALEDEDSEVLIDFFWEKGMAEDFYAKLLEEVQTTKSEQFDKVRNLLISSGAYNKTFRFLCYADGQFDYVYYGDKIKTFFSILSYDTFLDAESASDLLDKDRVGYISTSVYSKETDELIDRVDYRSVKTLA